MYSMYLLSNCPKVYLAFISLSQEVFGLAFTNCLKKLRTVTTSLLWYKHEIKLKDEVGMAVPKSTQTRFCRDNHINYTSLRLLFEYESQHMHQ